MTQAIEETRQISYEGARLFMDATRATQWGTWTGALEVEGDTIDLGADGIRAVKDRSWGVRSINSWLEGAPGKPPEMLFLWAPIHFDTYCFHFLMAEKPDGSTWASDAVVVPKLAVGEIPGDPVPLARVEHRIDWAPGQRRSRDATLPRMHSTAQSTRCGWSRSALSR